MLCIRVCVLFVVPGAGTHVLFHVDNFRAIYISKQ